MKKKNKIALESQVKYCIAAKPNNLLFLQTVCHCYDGDVETVFFFLSLLFLFFSPPLQKFPTPSESNKEKKSFTQSQFEFLHAYLPVALWIFFFGIVDAMPVSAADGPKPQMQSLSCAHTSQLNTGLQYPHERVNELSDERQKKAYMCVYMY